MLIKNAHDRYSKRIFRPGEYFDDKIYNSSRSPHLGINYHGI